MAFGVVCNHSVQTNEHKPYSQNESRNNNYGVKIRMFIGEVHFLNKTTFLTCIFSSFCICTLFCDLKGQMSSQSAKKLGKGTFGYVMEDRKGNAQKHFFKDCQEAALRETTIGKVMNHKCLMKLLKTNYTADEKSITMKRAIGSVEDLIDSHFEYGEAFIQTVIDNLVNAVAYIHSMGVMHRDIKPANILIFDEKHTVLTDFSLSKFECEAECHSPRCGTGHYMAPELSDCNYNMSVDDYAVGVSIVEIVLATSEIPGSKTPNAIELIKGYNSEWHSMISKFCSAFTEKRLKCTDINDCSAGFCVAKVQLDNPNDDTQAFVESVLENLDVHDKYFGTLGQMTNHWKNVLLKAKKKHLLEFVICAVCLVFGFCTDELFSCFAVFEQHIVSVINDMRSTDGLLMYACEIIKNKKHVRSPQKDPFLCEIHDENDSESGDESAHSQGSDVSNCSSQSSVWERPVVDWENIISSCADKKLGKLRKSAKSLET